MRGKKKAVFHKPPFILPKKADNYCTKANLMLNLRNRITLGLRFMPQISLIIPLYNAEKYLEACLASVAAQSFRDFEVLCINDGSKDKTEEIVQSFVAKDSRFKLINQENAGCSAARNHGIELAEAPYIAFLDQDDMLHPQAFEALYYMVTRFNADVAAFKNKTVPDDFVPQEIKHYNLEELDYKFSTTPFDDFFAGKKNGRGGSVLVWNRLYSKAAVKGLDFPVNVQPAEDTIYTLKVLFQIKNMVTTDAEFLFYRDSSTSVMNQGKTEKYVKSHALAAQVMYEYFIKSGLAQGERKKLLNHYLARFIFKSLVSQPLRLPPEKSKRYEFWNFARECVAILRQGGAYEPKVLGWRFNLASYLFLHKQYLMARALV